MRFYFTLILLPFTILCFGQSTYVPLNKDYYHLLDRYEILNGQFSQSFFTTIKPIERKAIAEFIDSINIDSTKLSKADQFNIEYLKNDNWEWTNAATSDSKKPFLKHFYKKKSDLYSFHNKDFDLHVNPVVYFQYGKEKNAAENMYINTRGLEIRGMIDNKIGFYAFAADNQARFPGYVSRFTANYKAVPGEGFYKGFKKTGVDFLTARGYITFNATRHIQVQFGHDKNFIGDGYRTLILSDFSSNYTFLKVNAKIWKFNYMNLFTEMNAGTFASNQLYPKKYVALHHLSLNITPNINVGLFETEVFGRSDSLKNGTFDINYLNPIIFYRSIEQQQGSADNALLGMDLKVNFLKHFSFYGQLILDEFFLKNVKAGTGWWANKQAGQLGLKYINAAGIKNLDLQGEVNIIRPYTYAHKSLYTSYTHYNQPLAHPMGANLYELIGIIRYQPIKRLSVTAKLFYTKIGLDSTTNLGFTDPKYNFGSNPLKSYQAVASANTYENTIAQGITTNIVFFNFIATYQIKHNLFIDFTSIIRKSTSESAAFNSKDVVTSLAIRWNIAQRLQEF